MYAVPEGQTMYTKQKCKDGLRGACFELVNAAGQAEVSRSMVNYFSFTVFIKSRYLNSLLIWARMVLFVNND